MSDDVDVAGDDSGEPSQPIRSGEIGLYNPANFRFGPKALAALQQETAQQPLNCRTLFEVFPATIYARPPPLLIDSADPNFSVLIREHFKTCPQPSAATVVLQLADAVITSCIVHSRSQDGYDILYESWTPEQRGGVFIPDAEQLGKAVGDFEARPDRAHVFISGRGWFNYGHWLIDDVPRAAAVRSIHARTGKPVTLLVLCHRLPIDLVREQALTAMLPPEVPCEIVFLDPDMCYRVPDLLFVTPPTMHPIWKSPEALQTMSRTILARATRPAGPARIFVPRRQAHGRALADQEAVERTLHANGFVTIDPEGMSFDAQVTAFAGARVVIGGMGAAMCNTVFCAPGTRLVYLAPVGWMEPFYWDLAAACGHRYATCYGRATEPDLQPWESGYEITPRQVTSILRFVAETADDFSP